MKLGDNSQFEIRSAPVANEEKNFKIAYSERQLTEIENNPNMESLNRDKFYSNPKSPLDLGRIAIASAEDVIRVESEKERKNSRDLNKWYEQELPELIKIIKEIDLGTFEDVEKNKVAVALLADKLKEWTGKELSAERNLLNYLKAAIDTLSAVFLKIKEQEGVYRVEDIASFLATKSKDVKYIQDYPSSGSSLYKTYTYWENICQPKLKALIESIQNDELSLDDTQPELQDKLLEITADGLIFEMPIAVATRNRFEIDKETLKEQLREEIKKQQSGAIREPLVIVSIAAGSGLAVSHGVAEVLKELNSDSEKVDIKMVFVDSDPTALKLSQQIAEKFGLKERTITIKTGKFDIFRPNYTKNLLNRLSLPLAIATKASGLSDYLSSDLFKKVDKNLLNILKEGGISINTNIKGQGDYPQKEILENLLNWLKMYSRENEEIINLHTQAIKEEGLRFRDFEIVSDPQDIYNVIITKK